LEDISARALRILSEVNLIAAEDTRRTGRLLKHYGIDTRLISYHEHNKTKKIDSIIRELVNGDVALVSDAGTPVLNDPGYELVRAALNGGIQVSPIPGPTSHVAALVASGLPSDSFLYLGYIPRKTNPRRQLLLSVSELPYTLVLLETPPRLLDSLNVILETLGDREICIAREITKLHEEFFHGRTSDAVMHFSESNLKGEITLVVSGRETASEEWSEDAMISELRSGDFHGQSASSISKKLSVVSGWPRREIYNLLNKIRLEEKSENESG
jgi:16S rRNA (cytidine1402-2'-O)-methyltransferase